MQSTALPCVLLAASVSLVSAAPAREDTMERISYKAERGKPQHAAAPTPKDPASPAAAAAADPGWIELASATPASHGREFVMVGADAGTFSQLRITAASGRPEIHAVRVDYQDGGHRVFLVDRRLDARRRPAYLDLRGAHELKQIVVVTDRTSSGSYVLEGNTGEAAVASRR
jgi:hypothetical protein